MSEYKILDPACGSRMFWFDKQQDGVVFGDIRNESHVLCDGRSLSIKPSAQMDFRALPFCDGQFQMVVFDPPHLIKAGDKSWMAKKYGVLGADWKQDIADGFSECFRVLNTSGSLIFKWNETQIKVSEIKQLSGQAPLFGHRSGKQSKTHWLCFSNIQGLEAVR